ncbi:MAG: flavodoxin-dependent (E)-4-hydroxy-3-methylbut-2-enyl-diphosphate synthase [Candidatus Woesearchaeota archaeon]
MNGIENRREHSRKKTKVVDIGGVKIGGGNKIAVQSMCNTFTQDTDSTIKQIKNLESAGCDIIRLAVPDMDSVNALRNIKCRVRIPVVADIHFDHKLAIECAGIADKIRINPGNIGGEERYREVIRAVRDNRKAMRIGVNTGSLEKDIIERFGRGPEGVVESAARAVRIAEEEGFNDIMVSLKSSDVADTISAYRLFSERFDHPLHLGVTEAGPLPAGAVKSSVGIGALLAEGIGDTIRVSLTEDPVEEVHIAYEILKSLGLSDGRVFISCPTCGRTNPMVMGIAREIEERTRHISRPIRIAVMGCEVNGPGEAKNADIGIAFSKDRAFIFRKGKIIRESGMDDAVSALMDEIDRMIQDSDTR